MRDKMSHQQPPAKEAAIGESVGSLPPSIALGSPASKMEAVGQLAAGIAHDFNNLVQVILGHAEMAQQDAGVPNDTRQSLAEIQRAAKRAGELTHQLLAFSRRQALEMKPVDLNGLIAAHLEMLHRTMGDRIALHTQPDPARPHAYADPAQIEQVLLNLVVNARHATPDNGSITIRTGSQTIPIGKAQREAWARPGDFAFLEVEDTGYGIDPDVLPHIFAPFFTTKEPGQGTGLGLSAVLGIVKQHNGLVQVDSEPGKGARFRILLPPATARAPEKARGVAPEEALRGSETILIAEDDPAVRRYLIGLLKSAGYTVLAAENGRHALELFERQPQVIDLLLLDVIMPEMNGWETHRRISECRPEIPALFCSGYNPDDLPGSPLRPGKVRIIQKPYDRSTLLTMLRRALDGV